MLTRKRVNLSKNSPLTNESMLISRTNVRNVFILQDVNLDEELLLED